MDTQDLVETANSALLDDLIELQHVRPVASLDDLSRLWPVADDPDQFLQYILRERAERRRLSSNENR